MGLGNLIRTAIIDRNGKHTHVNKKQLDYAKKNRLQHPNNLYPVAVDAGSSNYSTMRRVTVGSELWHLAPEDATSGIYCAECETHVSGAVAGKWATGEVNCDNCGEQISIYNLGISILPSSAKFIDKEAVVEGEWYHASLQSEWKEDLAASTNVDGDMPLVHLGTIEAAMSRARVISQSNRANKPVYIYKVKVKEKAPISDHLVGDGMMMGINNQPQTVYDALEIPEYAAFGVTRYVNSYESIGSVSLIAHPESFDVESTIDLPEWVLNIQ